ncbi:uncharacterized protein BJ171DRAFT_609020 [Polychytrium aggregatum]|uniref:uncharacterized protein n=1 Tax=Polychytrium aggregatum TaxID=110093 RepID=UPI0022FE1440|nr:uncharacterized protein BJ171DRAFT_609020 [Polychytrium aggregatum]KAI9209740.1 hypothetical protein BJ171DRAFT_609020 [Polychytrium aggregatum]
MKIKAPKLPNAKQLLINKNVLQERFRDTKNFPIEKKMRFSGRFFQIVLSAFAYYWLASQDSALMTKYGLFGVIGYSWFLNLACPCVAGLLILQHFAGAIISAWTSRKMMVLETLCDVTIMALWLFCIIAAGILMGPNCPPGTSHACDCFNWVLATEIMSWIAWTYGVVLDFVLWYKVLWGGMEEIDDMEMNRALRQTARKHPGGGNSNVF